MEKIIEGFYKVLHRFHTCRPKMEGHGDLTNVEFFMLWGISNMIDKKRTDENDSRQAAGYCCSNGITLGEIIKPIGMSMSAASKKISILEKKGLIERKNSTEDRRNVYITLTEKGKEICVREKEQKQERMVEIIQRMGTEDARKLIELLNQMFDIMEDLEKEENR